ncbi:RHS repeat domain-containing protein [Aliikangiella sp. IMCC44359]|uniref:RHS repeat domain-containing protein n=1 Tax=Aliikangiella sp. IMCC44359 TaxID=3459125 RepID=UPI00403AB059
MGNTLTKADLTFTYNHQGRLKTASKTGMNATYTYNYRGERSSKVVNSIKTHFIYDLQGRLIVEANGAMGSVQKQVIYINGQRLASINNGTVYYVHTDHLNTPVALTDDSGVVQWKAYYTPFGKAIIEVNNIVQDHRFPGQYYDDESGLHYNYFRDYDVEIGRYIESDLIGLNGGVNTYGYVLANPIMYIDPLGLKTLCEAMKELANGVLTNPFINGLPFDRNLLSSEVVPSGGGPGDSSNFIDHRNNLSYDIQYIQVGWSITQTYGPGSSELAYLIYMIAPAAAGNTEHFSKANLGSNIRGLNLGKFGARTFPNFEDFVKDLCPDEKQKPHKCTLK